jgi:FkbM family methyltransferase
MKWILDNPNDVIQNCLARGNWFEKDYLDVMSKYCNSDSVILDVGANIGNHTVYFSKIVNAKTIYVIEPIVRSYRMLLANIALNYCHNVNVDHIGLGLGHQECIGYAHAMYGKDNLGATRLLPEPTSTSEGVQIVTGDSIFENIKLDFIKMDIEGMEMLALDGLKNTIKNSRPNIFLEVIEENKQEFNKWLEDNRYDIVYSHDQGDVYEENDPNKTYDYMIVPR